MARYQSNLDKKLFSQTKEFESTRITVGVFSYNEGEKKVQISRENKNAEGEWRFARLGRLSKEEIEAAVPLIQEAITKI